MTDKTKVQQNNKKARNIVTEEYQQVNHSGHNESTISVQNTISDEDSTMKSSLTHLKTEIENLTKEISILKKENSKQLTKLDEQSTLIDNLREKIHSLYREIVSHPHTTTSEVLSATVFALESKVDHLSRIISEKENYIESTHLSLDSILQDHLKSFPYLAGMIADYLLLDDYRYNNYHGKSIEKIERKLRIDTLLIEKKELIKRSKEIQYQLDYLLTVFPAISDFLDTEYKAIPLTFNYADDHDPTRDYLSSDEYHNLSESHRNQLALDRYIDSRKKSKWQIGRDYELSVGFQYEKKGYKVQYTGSLEGLSDLGRDLIATKDNTVLIIQCKYWSTEKVIREKHIAQLFGTALCYQIDHQDKEVTALFITSTKLSDEAKSFADKLHVIYVENYSFKEFPRIKCNIGQNELGEETYIYHLPMDQQYDSVIIDKPGEFMAFTVEEAESKGFRRAYKWHSA